MDLSFLNNINGIEIKPNARLAEYTTFRVGGTCPAIIICRKPEQIIQAITALVNKGIEFIIIGGGSNILVSDKGIRQIVIQYLSSPSIIKKEGNELIISAGSILDDVCQFAAEKGLTGINFLSGIPGTIGGAIVGNAGAFGKQIGDAVKSVFVIDSSASCKTIYMDELKFGYRDSIFKKNNGLIIISVRLSLKAYDKKYLQEEREQILKLRMERHPDIKKTPCAGCFFKNIPTRNNESKKESAGKLIEKAGARKLDSGKAGLFEKHANIIINPDAKASAQEIFDLSEKIHGLVKEKFGIELIREVRLIGHFKGMPAGVNNPIW